MAFITTNKISQMSGDYWFQLNDTPLHVLWRGLLTIELAVSGCKPIY